MKNIPKGGNGEMRNFPNGKIRNFPNGKIKNLPKFPQIQKISLEWHLLHLSLFAGVVLPCSHL